MYALLGKVNLGSILQDTSLFANKDNLFQLSFPNNVMALITDFCNKSLELRNFINSVNREQGETTFFFYKQHKINMSFNAIIEYAGRTQSTAPENVIYTVTQCNSASTVAIIKNSTEYTRYVQSTPTIKAILGWDIMETKTVDIGNSSIQTYDEAEYRYNL